jgi:hypothetical protein
MVLFHPLHQCFAIYRAVKNFQPEEGVFSGSLHKLDPNKVHAKGGDADREEHCQPVNVNPPLGGKVSRSPNFLEEEEE